MEREDYLTSKDNDKPDICLNCGDNRSQEERVICESCEEQMFMGGYVGDGL